jgi:UV DNA damage endonuclease
MTGGCMSLTVCCQWLEPRTKRDGSVVYENSVDENLLQLGAFKKGKYSPEQIKQTYIHNVNELLKLVPKLNAANIKSFRMSSNVLPLFEFNEELAKSNVELLNKFKLLGDMFKKNDIRVTCHPGQFAVISSDSDDIIANTIKELNYHAWMFDQMGFEHSPYYAINIHGGKRGNVERAIATINSLPEQTRKRLTLENDESSYNVLELLKIHDKTGTPIVWDSHHHTFNTGNMDVSTACGEAIKTWGNIKPLQHLSNTEIGSENGSFTERRKHSYYIHQIPEIQKQLILENKIDVDVEAKGKNLAVLKMRNDFQIIN